MCLVLEGPNLTSGEFVVTVLRALNAIIQFKHPAMEFSLFIVKIYVWNAFFIFVFSIFTFSLYLSALKNQIQVLIVESIRYNSYN